MTRFRLLLVILAVAGSHGLSARDPSALQTPALAPTVHPLLPSNRALFWIVPDGQRPSVAAGRLARGAKLVNEGDFSGGLALVRSADVSGTPLAGYAQYYSGVALLGLQRHDQAEAALVAARAMGGAGALDELVPIALSDLGMQKGDYDDAAELLEELSKQSLSAPSDVSLRLGRAAERAGEREDALAAYRRVHYEFPFSAEAAEAREAIGRLGGAAVAGTPFVARELSRAEQLFAARRWADARAAFAPLALAVAGPDRARVEVKLGACDFHLGRHRDAREALRSYATTPGPVQAEARYYYLSATRSLGSRDEYLRLTRQLVDEHPDSEWAQTALDELASFHIRQDDDMAADAVFREILDKFPRGLHTERAAWKAGWWSYRQGRFAEAAATFEQAAAAFPRADNRPAWLYWAGRSRDRLEQTTQANARYQLVVADYQNSYYGRLASQFLTARRVPQLAPIVTLSPTAPVRAVPTEAVIRALSAAGMYDEALREVRVAQAVWGDSPQLQATTAWLRHQRGLTTTSQERFNGLRGAITLMRRTYPHFLASGGEELPPEVLRIIYPLDYWPLITSYSKTHDLDPYLIAALMAQESTFTAEIRSSANAYGLMQIIPSTGRRYARIAGVRPFSTRMLTNPDVNVRIGTQIFRDLLDRFGKPHFALAGYNAGPHRVVRWREEAPGLEDDEFVDNIPFPETQAYVKRILGTAEDYRRLYGPGGPLAARPTAAAAPRRAD